MQISNLYTKPVLKGLFFTLIGLCIGTVTLGFSGWAPFDLAIHFMVGGLWMIAALLILTKSWFIRYNSTTEMIEIDRSRLFASPTGTVSRLGMNKVQIKDYHIQQYWLGAIIQIQYELKNGTVFKQRIPLTLFSTRHLAMIKSDLSRVINGNSESSLFIGST